MSEPVDELCVFGEYSHRMQKAIAQVHVIAAVGALLLGGVVFLIRKGTRLHVGVGFCDVVSMLTMTLTAFSLRTTRSA